MSARRRDGIEVYVQARRDSDGLEVEAVGDAYLPLAARRTAPQRDELGRLGWSAPLPPDEPNYRRLADATVDLHELADIVVRTLCDGYDVPLDAQWSVTPPELGAAGAGHNVSSVNVEDSEDSDIEMVEPHEIGWRPSDLADPAKGASAQTSFTPAVQEKLGWYVYLLRDPRNDEVFYVGKGRGNRIFAHAATALAQGEDDQASLKLDRIRAIHAAGHNVGLEILRHHLSSEAVAYTVEAAVLDTFRATGRPLANIVRGHHHELYGWATARTVSTIYEAPPLADIELPLVLVKISQLWTPAMSDAALFSATRGWWRVGTRVLGAAAVLAVSKGVTRAAYRVAYWRERVPGDRDYSEADQGRRLGFWREPAIDLAHLVGRSTTHLRQAAGSPCIYLNLEHKPTGVVPLYRGEQARLKAEEELEAG